VEFTPEIKLAPAHIKNFDFLYFIVEDQKFNEEIEELTRRLYSLK